MRTLVLALLLCLVAPPLAAQQITPAVEISGGYAAIDDADDTLNGWVASVAVPVTRWFSVAGEVGGNYYDQTFEFLGSTRRVNAHELGFLGGPRVSIRASRLTPWVQFLVGATRDSVDDVSETHGALQPGGGLDFWISQRIGIRGGVDYRGIYVDDEWEGDSRVHIGVVIGLGER